MQLLLSINGTEKLAIGALALGFIIFVALAALGGSGKKTVQAKQPEPMPVSGSKDARLSRMRSLYAQAIEEESQAAYAKLFEKIYIPIQMLIALLWGKQGNPALEKHIATQVREPIRHALQKCQASCTEDGLRIPAPLPAGNPQLQEWAQAASETEIESEISELKQRIARAKAYQAPKQALDHCARHLKRLADPDENLTMEQMQAIAGGVCSSLEQGGIIPLFWDDERIRKRPDLQALYMEASGKELILPGFYVVKNGQLQLYGNYQGTCPGKGHVDGIHIK